MRHIYVVTHPQATHHVDGLVGGWYDSVLTDRGLEHAQQLAHELDRRIRQDHPGQPVVRVVSSDLTRTRETAQLIAETLNVPVQLDARLREQSYGEAEGQPTGTHPYAPVPDGGDRLNFISGPGVESRAVWAGRVYTAMTELFDDDAPVTIVVTHGGSLTYAVAAWIGMPLAAADRVKFRASPGSITVLHDDAFHGDRVVAELNATAHLL